MFSPLEGFVAWPYGTRETNECSSMNTISRAVDLPDAWDAVAAGNFALQRRFLRQLEGCTSTEKRYHLFHDDGGRLDSIICEQSIDRFNLTQYTPIDWRVRARLLHVPLSVARPGLVVGDRTRGQVEDFVRSLPGFTIILNWPGDEGFTDMAAGTMSPQLRLRVRWTDFDAYLESLRSGYRHRLRKALRKGRELRFRILQDNREFDERLYGFYRRINERARVRVETLGIEWFRSSLGRIIVCEHRGVSQGFIQLVENGRELVWTFVGYAEETNTEYDVYQNLLVALVRHAIENRFETVDMGQTAEEAKLKLGCEYVPLRVLVRHSLAWKSWLCRRLMPYSGHKPVGDNFRVFRGADAPAGRRTAEPRQPVAVFS